MTTSRVSTYNFQQTTLRDAMDIQTRLLNTQQQISSGLRANNYKEMSGDVEQFTALDNKLQKATQYGRTNTVVGARLDTTDNALSQIIESTTNLKNLILLRRNNSTTSGLAFDQQLQGLWSTIASQLNTNSEGRYLFSGTDTATPAVDGSKIPTLVTQGVPDAGYYQGSTDDITARVQDGIDMKYNVRADDAGFQKIIAAIATAQKGSAQGSDELLSQAYDLLQHGIERVVQVQTNVAANKVTLDQVNTQMDAMVTYWKGVKDGLVNTDLVSASTQVAADQANLQAAFQAYAKINALQLSDYLR
jgi:flagellar hook-associated protein 3 FlgL